MSSSEKFSTPPDEIGHRAQIDDRLKEEQKAWRELLESLANLRKKPAENPDTKEPSE